MSNLIKLRIMTLKSYYNNFLSIITGLLQKINHEHINYFQFYLIIKEANIKFTKADQIQKYKRWFTQNHPIHKHMILNVLQLTEAYTKNNQQYFFVKMPESIEEAKHKNMCCFRWWMDYMHQKYGSTMKWFQIIAGKTNSYAIKIHVLKSRITELTRNTQHEKCVDKICSFFQRNNKNEIEWVVFMNIIRKSHKIMHRPHRSQHKISQCQIIRSKTNSFSRPKTPYSKYRQKQYSTYLSQSDKKNLINLSTSLHSQKVKLEKAQNKFSTIKIIKKQIQYRHFKEENYLIPYQNQKHDQRYRSHQTQPIV